MFVVLFSSCAVVCLFIFFCLVLISYHKHMGFWLEVVQVGSLAWHPAGRPRAPAMCPLLRARASTHHWHTLFHPGKALCLLFVFSLTHPPSHTFSPVLATSFASVSKVLDKHRFCIGLLTKMYLASYCDYLRSSEYY